MRDRKVIMSVDGQGDEAREVTTGLSQGSPISPVLFAIYIAEIHGRSRASRWLQGDLLRRRDVIGGGRDQRGLVLVFNQFIFLAVPELCS